MIPLSSGGFTVQTEKALSSKNKLNTSFGVWFLVRWVVEM
jgi:hypothetical protein